MEIQKISNQIETLKKRQEKLNIDKKKAKDQLSAKIVRALMKGYDHKAGSLNINKKEIIEFLSAMKEL